MESLQNAIATREVLNWMQPNPLLLRSELRIGDTLLATLAGSQLGHDASIETAEGKWAFETIRSKIILSQGEEAIECGTFRSIQMLGGKGILELSSGKHFYWVRGVLLPWQTLKGRWQDENGLPLMRFQIMAAGLSHAGLITLEQGTESKSDTSLLVLFGWFLIAFR